MSHRRTLAAEIDRIDAEILALQSDKKEIFGAYREAHGKAETKAAKVAIKRRQNYAAGKRDEIEQHDALVDEIFAEIQPGTVSALTRASRHEAA